MWPFHASIGIKIVTSSPLAVEPVNLTVDIALVFVFLIINVVIGPSLDVCFVGWLD